MKTNSILRKLLAALAVSASVLLLSGPAQASVTYHADINTSALNNSPASGAGPFFLDFSLTDGNSGVFNNVTISNFQFVGGTATGSSTGTGTNSGTGDFGSTVTLTDAGGNLFNDVYQGFTPGTTHISFDVTSSNLNSGAFGFTPDAFNIALLGSDLNNLPTTSPDGLSVLSQAFDATLTAGAFNNIALGSTSGSGPTGIDTSGVTINSVPEPSRAMLLMGGLGALVFRRRRAPKGM